MQSNVNSDLFINRHLGLSDVDEHKMLFKLGFVRSTRFVFWKYLYLMFKKNPGGIGNFFTFAVFMEHFLPYRKMVKKEIQEALQARMDGNVKALETDIELSKDLAKEVEWYKAS